MRVVITAAGGISTLGSSTEELITSFKGDFLNFEELHSVSTAPVRRFNLNDYIGRYKNKRYLNRGASFAVAGAYKTVIDSNIELSKDCGLFIGAGPNLNIPNAGMNYESQKALWILEHLPNTAASSISTLLGINGENSTIGTACSASLQAIGEGFRRIKHGHCKMAVVGGGDSRLSEGGVKGYHMAGALYKGNSPSNEYSPLRSEPLGFIPGEGAAFFILESLESAINNDRTILAEILGFGLSMDGYNMTDPDPCGVNQERAIISAIIEAGLTTADIGIISCHGTGTLLNDTMEKDIINRIFKNQPFIATFKEWFGHLSAACGAMELWAIISCFKSGEFPTSHRSIVNSPYDNTTADSNIVLLQNFGFGGQNATLVVKKWI